MADNRKKFLGPNAGSLRDPLSNAKEHMRNRNPPRFSEIGGFSSASKGFSKNEHGLASVSGSVV